MLARLVIHLGRMGRRLHESWSIFVTHFKHTINNGHRPYLYDLIMFHKNRNACFVESNGALFFERSYSHNSVKRSFKRSTSKKEQFYAVNMSLYI